MRVNSCWYNNRQVPGPKLPMLRRAPSSLQTLTCQMRLQMCHYCPFLTQAESNLSQECRMLILCISWRRLQDDYRQRRKRLWLMLQAIIELPKEVRLQARCQTNIELEWSEERPQYQGRSMRSIVFRQLTMFQKQQFTSCLQLLEMWVVVFWFLRMRKQYDVRPLRLGPAQPVADGAVATL